MCLTNELKIYLKLNTYSAIPTPLDENNPNYEKGEFRMILQLVKKLPNGRQIKQEVSCHQLHKNFHTKQPFHTIININ